MSALAALRGFARPRPHGAACVACAAELPDAHAHLVERRTGRLGCACAACASGAAGPGAPWARVRPGVRRLRDVRLSDGQWRALGLPVELAFFVRSGATGRVLARYPGAAGTVECGLPLEAWEALAAAHPALAELEPDVEALLVNRTGGRSDCYRASLDECYRLAGVIRARWRGLGGGPEVWRAIEAFFADLDAREAGA